MKEQYNHIFNQIVKTGLVKSFEEGVERVLQSKRAKFALVHEASQIKYRVSKDCNLTTIGEVFSEQPFAIAVQQGSRLQENLSRT